MCVSLHVNTLYYTQMFIKFNFSAYFRKKKIFKYQISWKSVQFESSCSKRTDGQTDGYDEAFLYFVNALKDVLMCKGRSS